MNMPLKKSLRAALATTIFGGGAVILAAPAAAQTTSTVQGHVDNAPAGTIVTVTDSNTGHQDSAKVDENGNYILVGLPPSTYRVASDGKSVVVVAPLGQAVTADLVAEASTTKDIVVTASRAKDVRSTDRQYEYLPVPARKPAER